MDITVDVGRLVRVKNDGSDSEVLQTIMSLAGEQPSPEALERIDSMRPAERRQYLSQLIYNLAKEDAPPYVTRRTSHR
jgi:hypothetical protein